MDGDGQAAPVAKWMLWSGYVVSTLVVLTLIMSAIFKFMRSDDILKEFTRLGYSEGSAVGLGILELVCVAVYAIPQTAVLGAILLTGYFGGAVATHVRIGEGFVSPAVIGVLAWLGVYLRDAAASPDSLEENCLNKESPAFAGGSAMGQVSPGGDRGFLQLCH